MNDVLNMKSKTFRKEKKMENCIKLIYHWLIIKKKVKAIKEGKIKDGLTDISLFPTTVTAKTYTHSLIINQCITIST